ncbi:E3 ubiquitin-protein ligase RNF13 [Morella rubra]|uniref:RING-type E3 ubiquitin transferase n=1 Tax=Morella rubra TaxID=262757 RepID=A0A6A1ULK7_9ROSI|nr:E3 ubiquitin-protein ligase RNF13 [Morella rubra]
MASPYLIQDEPEIWVLTGIIVFTSVRTRRLVNGHTRARLPNQGNGNSLSPNKPSIAISQVLQSNISVELNAPSSSHQFSAEIPSSRAISYSRPGSGRERLRGVAPDNGVEVGITHSSMNQDSVRRYNIDGIAEEEFVVGDDMGRLRCEHGYHAVCIQQWLRLKNWCPICKASAAPSPSSSSS